MPRSPTKSASPLKSPRAKTGRCSCRFSRLLQLACDGPKADYAICTPGTVRGAAWRLVPCVPSKLVSDRLVRRVADFLDGAIGAERLARLADFAAKPDDLVCEGNP